MIPLPLPATDVTDIAHTIQLAVAPVFLLTGIAGLLNVLAGRLARVVDRSRLLEAEFTDADHPGHALQVWELRALDKRIRYANNAIFLCSISAVLVCLVVAGLFVAELANLGFARTMALGFILAMALLIAGLILFLLEIRVALNSVRVREELLEREAKQRR